MHRPYVALTLIILLLGGLDIAEVNLRSTILARMKQNQRSSNWLTMLAPKMSPNQPPTSAGSETFHKLCQ
jgi:hypothetical protein